MSLTQARQAKHLGICSSQINNHTHPRGNSPWLDTCKSSTASSPQGSCI
ncbi:hypothetical protein Vi05172_g2096 [Venturia inaequalis]|nr:hypothetical protein Vi05172_g2096 [Venturia inaequalis]